MQDPRTQQDVDLDNLASRMSAYFQVQHDNVNIALTTASNEIMISRANFAGTNIFNKFNLEEFKNFIYCEDNVISQATDALRALRLGVMFFECNHIDLTPFQRVITTIDTIIKTMPEISIDELEEELRERSRFEGLNNDDLELVLDFLKVRKLEA